MPADPNFTELLARSHERQRHGDLPGAMQKAQEALALARANGDSLAVADSLLHLTWPHYRMGHYAQAAELAEQARSLAPESVVAVNALRLLGTIAAETQTLAEGESQLHRAADLSRQIGDRLSLSTALQNLAGDIYIPQGKFGPALATLQEAHRLSVEAGRRN